MEKVYSAWVGARPPSHLPTFVRFDYRALLEKEQHVSHIGSWMSEAVGTQGKDWDFFLEGNLDLLISVRDPNAACLVKLRFS